MSCTLSPITCFVEKRSPVSLAKILAETSILHKMREIALSICNLIILNALDERFISISNQVKSFHGFHVDFSFWGIDLNLKYLEQILVCVLPLHSFIQCLFRYPESTNDSNIVKMNNLILPVITQENSRNFWWGLTISSWWYPFLNQI